MHSGASVNAVTKSGTNRLSRQRLRVPPRPAVQRDRIRSRRSGPTASGWTTACSATSSAARSAGRSSRDRLFFFGAYQGTTHASDAVGEHRVRADAGDAGRRLHGVRLAGVQRRAADRAARAVRRTTGSIPRCSARRRCNLRGELPTTTDPCGEITFSAPRDSNEWQGVGKVDYQWSANHTLFGRYMRHVRRRAAGVGRRRATSSTTATAGGDRTDHGAVADARRHARVRRQHGQLVALRLQPHVDLTRDRAPFFDARVARLERLHNYVPGKMALTITGGFNIGQADSIRSACSTPTPTR